MQNNKIKESPLFWPVKLVGNAREHSLRVLDETLLPDKLEYIKVRNTQEAVNVIRQMKTRAFGQFLVVLNAFLLELGNNAGIGFEPIPARILLKRIQQTAEALNNSRPTFPFSEVTSIVVGWAEKAASELSLRAQQSEAKQSPRLLRRLSAPRNDYVVSFVRKNIFGYLEGIRQRRLERVHSIAQLIKDGDSILTHCNVSGELAMAAYIAQQAKKKIQFFATETRPYLQGAKLTCWELKKMGANVVLVADNAVGALMSNGFVNKVIVGSDRSCANGDFANKIGTYQIAVLAKEFDIPFYVLRQPSTQVAQGEDIPIEIRDEKELLNFKNRRIVEKGVRGFYPAFDVVPHELITESLSINVN